VESELERVIVRLQDLKTEYGFCALSPITLPHVHFDFHGHDNIARLKLNMSVPDAAMWVQEKFREFVESFSGDPDVPVIISGMVTPDPELLALLKELRS
jgi:hypothetical protein